MFDFESPNTDRMFVYQQRVREEYLYSSVVQRGCVQGPDT